jgi:hypothetical protein
MSTQRYSTADTEANSKQIASCSHPHSIVHLCYPSISSIQHCSELQHFILTFCNYPGAHTPPIQWAQGALSQRIKRPGREADHSPSSSAEVKECVKLYLHSPLRLHCVVLS